jgi:uncharacterized protein (TIGR00288 family)
LNLTTPFGDTVNNHRVAVFIDFENIKRAVDEYFENERVDIKRILDEINRITQGRIILKRAYADWGAFKDYRSDLLENSTEPVQTFSLTHKGKNGADIRMAVDVIEFVLRQTDITHIALASGDSDFTPLVMKLRELGRYVVGVGVRSNTSNYLAKSCDRFIYYDDIRDGAGSGTPRFATVAPSAPTAPVDPLRLIALALAALGNGHVAGSALKMQMRKLDPSFDESRLGHASFLEFLRANANLVDVYKPAVGDVTVAPKGQLGLDMPALPEATLSNPIVRSTESIASPSYHNPSYTPYVPSDGIPYQAPPPPPPPSPAPLTTTDKYKIWLRDNNFRYVKCDERQLVIETVYGIFEEAGQSGGLSLKEVKDKLHAWFEENRPAVPWDSVNSAVYHLFYTWCFAFDKTDEGDGKQLWDRRTTLQADITSLEELTQKVERGIIRKLWEKDRETLEAEAVNEWLYDGNTLMLARVREMVETVALTLGSNAAKF